MLRFNKRNLTCATCGRKFNEHVMDHLCQECYEIASWDNEANDSGEPLSEATCDSIGKMLNAIAKKGGDVEAVKASNDFIDWDAVSRPAVRKGATHSDSRRRFLVKVNGSSFASAQGAFRQLRLPMTQLMRVRAELKATGKATVEGKDNNGKAKTFKITTIK